jgi:hypothetical protein
MELAQTMPHFTKNLRPVGPNYSHCHSSLHAGKLWLTPCVLYMYVCCMCVQVELAQTMQHSTKAYEPLGIALYDYFCVACLQVELAQTMQHSTAPQRPMG